VANIDDETQRAWEAASQKHIREYDDLLDEARTATLLPIEERLLRPIVEAGADVVHPMSGHGIDDVALARLGARSVVGVDYSPTAVASAQRRAHELRVPCRYLLAQMPNSTLDSGCADLIYTGKGALIWVADLAAWLTELTRLLRPGGHLFIYESHPLVPLWAWDSDEIRVRADRSYFARSFVNDSFPAHGAVERQNSLAEIVMALVHGGFAIEHFAEHPEPFWRPDGAAAAAWDGRVPNSFSLLARMRE
jgi:SAM-dependent methyltransferase